MAQRKFLIDGGFLVNDDSEINANLTMTGNILPSVDSDGTTGYDLGSPSAKWRDLYLSEGSLYINNQKVIEDNSGTIIVRADEDQSLTVKTEGTGVLTLQSAQTVNFAATLQMAADKRITDAGGDAVTFGDKVDMDGNRIVGMGAPINDNDSATKKYVDDKFDDVLGGAPAALDTLNELANALGDDANYAATITTALATKATTTYVDTQISNLQTTVNANAYGDSDVADYISGNQTFFSAIRANTSSATIGTWTDPFRQINGKTIGLTESLYWPSSNAPHGSYTMVEIKGQDGTGQLHAEFYPDVIKPGGSTAGDNVKLEPNTGGFVDVSDSKISNVSTPTGNTDAANKAYVDSQIAANAYGDSDVDARLQSGALGSVNLEGEFEVGQGDSLSLDGRGSNKARIIYKSETNSGTDVDYDLLSNSGQFPTLHAYMFKPLSGTSNLLLRTGTNGYVDVGNARIADVATPTSNQDAANKVYVDAAESAANAYTDAAITNLIGGAPGALDTLNELAAALGDDADYAASITTALAAVESTNTTQATQIAANSAAHAQNASDIAANATAVANAITTASADATSKANAAEAAAKLYTDQRETAITTAYTDAIATAVEAKDAVSELADVSFGTLQNNQIMRYNATSGLWTNVTQSTDAVAEGTNLYFTDQRAKDAVAQDIADAVATETSNRIIAQNANAQAISTEATTRGDADAALSGRLDVIEGADTVEGSVAKALKDAKAYADQAEVDAKSYTDARETVLQSNIDTEKGRIDAILNAADADKDSFAEIVTFINSVDTTNDDALGTEITTRAAADTALSGRLDVIEGADTVEGSVAKALKDAKAYADTAEADAVSTAAADASDKANAAQSAAVTAANSYTDARETAITTAYESYADTAEADAVSTASADATSKANTAEANAKAYTDAREVVLQGNIDTEKDRIDAILSASSADKDTFAEIVTFINSVDTSNDSALGTEITTRANADAALQNDINDEIADRIAGDQNLQSQIDAIDIGNGNFSVIGGTGLTGSGSMSANQDTNSSATLSVDTSWLNSVVDARDEFVSGVSFNTGNGVLTLDRQLGSNLTVDLDGRYELAGTNDNYGSWTIRDHDGTSYTVTSGDVLQIKEGYGIDVNFTADDQMTITAKTSTLDSRYVQPGDLSHEHGTFVVISSTHADNNATDNTNPSIDLGVTGLVSYTVFLNRQLLRPTEFTYNPATGGCVFSVGLLSTDDEVEITGLKLS